MASEAAGLSRIELQLLQRTAHHGQTSAYHLIPWQDGTLPEFWEAYQALVTKGLLTEVDSPSSAASKQVKLSEAGQKVLNESSSPAMLKLQCSSCEGRGYAIPSSATADFRVSTDFLATYSEILKNRPPPAAEYDQTAITEEDMVIRAGFLHERGDLAGKSVLLVGDADLLSICIALTGLPKRVMVIDIDVRVIEFVNSTAKSRGWDFVEARAFDVRLPFPHGMIFFSFFFLLFKKKFNLELTHILSLISFSFLLMCRPSSSI